MTTEKKKEKIRCLIIGSGPAGYTAAIYAARANLSPVLYEGMTPGGQLTTTTDIENYPGFPEKIGGFELMELMKNQAKGYNADIRWGVITHADLSSAPYQFVVDGEKEIEADAVIISTGANAKYLGLPDETRLKGLGVSACATCDGFFYRGKTVAVVGGGDTACEDALYLSRLAKKVYMIVRKNYLRASQVLQEEVKKAPNIEILFEHETIGLDGTDKVEGMKLVKFRGTPVEDTVDIAIDGFFVAIGHSPNSGLFKDYLTTDATGYIEHMPNSTRTSIPGVFIAGDVGDPVYRQAITAAATGCMAAIDAEAYLNTICV